MKFKSIESGLYGFDRDTGMRMLSDEVNRQKRTSPDVILWSITNRCNLLCSFCYADSKAHSNDVPLSQALKMLHDFDEWNVFEVAFGGGEPLCYPSFRDLIVQGWETTNVCLNFTTNSLLVTKDFAKAIRESVGQVRVSIYKGLQNNTYWNKVQESIEILRGQNIRLGFNILLTKHNFGLLNEIIEYGLKHDVESFFFLRFKKIGRGIHDDLSLLPEQELQMPRFIEAQKNLGVEIGYDSCSSSYGVHHINPLETYKCGAGETILNFTSDGTIKSCSFAANGVQTNFEINKIKQYFNSFKLPDSFCNDCVKHCFICPIDSYKFIGCQKQAQKSEV